MITLVKQGHYRLGETKNHSRVLFLDDVCYIWLVIATIGDIISRTTRKHTIKTVFSRGRYRLYDIADEPDLVDLKHLELEVGEDNWQGYLLLTGLPQQNKPRSRIIATEENISEYLHMTHRNAVENRLMKVPAP